MDLAIQIYNKKIVRKPNRIELYKSIYKSPNPYKEINKYFKIIDDLHDIRCKVKEDKFGKLVSKSKQASIGTEGYFMLLLPIMYYVGFDSKLVKLVVKWYFRNYKLKNGTFNKFSYSNEFLNICNKVIKDKQYDYYSDILKLFVKNIDIKVSNDNIVDTICSNIYKSCSTPLLLFIETCINTNSFSYPETKTLEHIYPQKSKDYLSNSKNIDKLGNHTLYEPGNSDNGHKGNSSLGAKSFKVKKIAIKIVILK